MIDITGLREDKRPQSSTIVHALLDRLEAVEKERDALRANTATLQQMTYSLKDRLEAAEKSDAESIAMYRRAMNECDALRAKIAEMGKQEPIGTALLCTRCSTPFDGDHYCPACGYHTATEENVYALPGAQSGATDEAHNE